MFGELSVFFCRVVLEYLLNSFTKKLCYNCPRRQGLRSRAGAKLPESRPPAHWTGRGPVNQGIMCVELSILLLFFLRFFSECAWVYGNGCVSECLYNTILVRRLWTVEKDV